MVCLNACRRPHKSYIDGYSYSWHPGNTGPKARKTAGRNTSVVEVRAAGKAQGPWWYLMVWYGLPKGPHVPVRSQSLLVVCRTYILKAENPIQYTLVYTMVCVSLWVCNFSTNPSRDWVWDQHSPNSMSLTSCRLWLPKFPKDIRDTDFAHVNLLFYSEAQHSWPHRPKRQNPRRCKCLGGFSQAIEYLLLGGCWCVKAELATKNRLGKLAPKMLGRLLPM